MFRKKKSIRKELEEIKKTQKTIIQCLSNFDKVNTNVLEVIDRNMQTLNVLTKNVVYKKDIRIKKTVKPVMHKEELSYQ